MSLIRQEKTQEEKILDRKNLIINKNAKLFNRLKMQLSDIFNMIWTKPTESIDENGDSVLIPPEITPQEIFDSFGAEAYKLFEMCNNIEIMMATIDSNYIPLTPPYEYTINGDGTVTVGGFNN